MERDLKGLIDSIDQKDKTESMLERKIESLKEEINRLKFTIREQKLLIQSLKETKNEDDNIILDDDVQLLKEMIFSQRQEILKKDEQIQDLKTKSDKIDIIVPLTGDSNNYIEEIENLNEKIGNLYEQLEIFKSNEENAKKLIEDFSQQAEISKKEIEEMQNYIQKLESEKFDGADFENIEMITEENKNLLSEIADYQSQIIDLQQSLESLENASKDEREKSKDINNQLSLDNERYLEEINTFKNKINNSDNLELKTDLISNIDEYYELEKHYENQMERLEFENKAYQVELESLRTQIREINKKELDSDEQPSELYSIESTEIIKSLKQENELLKESLSELNVDKMELSEKLLQMEENNTDFVNTNIDAEIESIIRELKVENQQLIQENKDIQTKLSIKLSDEAELKQIIDNLKIKNHKLKTKLEVNILEKQFEIPKESENQLFKNYLNNLDQNSIQQSIDKLIKDIRINKSYDIKKNSLYLLATLNDDKIKAFFSKLTMDKDWLIRFHLIKAIEKTQNLEYKDLLTKLSKDRDIDVREAAKDALSKL